MAANQAIAMNRFGLGGAPGDRPGRDPRGWLLAQLSRYGPRPRALAALPARSALVTDTLSHQREAAAMAAENSGPRLPHRTYMQAANARFAAAVESDTPFPERLVHFWANHFALTAEKTPVVMLAGNYEFEAIRPHILGNFADLVFAAVTHPAMLVYLDQMQSIGPASALGRRAAGRGLNENLAREILELHSLGARGGYDQPDVIELAKALTGWTVAGMAPGALRQLAKGRPGEAVFVEEAHEPGEREIMGRRYADSGAGQLRAIVADLVAHPATARHVATKLARHFIADDPPESAIAKLAQAFTASGGDLLQVCRALVSLPEVWSEDRAKFRTPWDWTVAAVRAGGADDMLRGSSVPSILLQFGQPVWRPGSPAGWPDTAADWAGSAALMTRVEVAQRFGMRIGRKVDAAAVAHAALADSMRAETRAAIRGTDGATGLAVLFSSPDFMWR